jgi:enamine deaminase RidA (YjgF/YER057c/UK114 family)
MDNTATPVPESRVTELGIVLPPAVPALGRYAGAVQTGPLLFCSGHLPEIDGDAVRGKLGRDVTTEEGYAAARQATINLLGTVRSSIGSLDKVTRVVKLFGMVNSDETFTEHPHVIDGASDLLHEIFGPRASHARTAVGMAQLPRNNCVEIEAVFEID